MSRFLSILLYVSAVCGISSIGNKAFPWQGTFISTSPQATLSIDLYNETVNVPGMDMFGPMNGYLGGTDIYGTWMVTSYKVVDNNKAEVRLSNDFGSETQAVELTIQNDTLLLFRMVDGTVIKKREGKRLVKLASQLTFHRQQ